MRPGVAGLRCPSIAPGTSRRIRSPVKLSARTPKSYSDARIEQGNLSITAKRGYDRPAKQPLRWGASTDAARMYGNKYFLFVASGAERSALLLPSGYL